jgi:hypothetical protein
MQRAYQDQLLKRSVNHDQHTALKTPQTSLDSHTIRVVLEPYMLPCSTCATVHRCAGRSERTYMPLHIKHALHVQQSATTACTNPAVSLTALTVYCNLSTKHRSWTVRHVWCLLHARSLIKYMSCKSACTNAQLVPTGCGAQQI